MRSVPAAVASLLRVALWEEVEGGWRIRSWERWNASEQAVSAGGRLGNHKRWHADRDVTDPDCEHCADRGAIGGRSGGESAPNRGGESQGKEREGKERTTTSAVADEPDPFDEFWKHYPRKTQKRDAEKAYRRTLKRADAETILNGLRRYPFNADPQFIPQAERWLNGDRWNDQPVQGVIPLRPSADGFTAAELDQILGPPRPLPQPPRGLDENAMWEWEQQTRREQRAERVRQANAKLGRSA